MREIFDITQDEIDDFTGRGPQIINNETYKFIDTFLIDGDGEWYSVIVERQKDKKLFEFHWGLDRSENYHYNQTWKEVKVKTIEKQIYIWE